MKLSLLMAGAALTMVPATFAQAANVQIAAENPVIELSVSEQVDSAPDTAMFSTGVETKAKTGINLRADYDYDQQSRENRFVGYVVSNQVSATVHDISKLGKILDAVVSSGATNLNGPTFSIDDDSKVKEVARERALANAKAHGVT